MDRSDVFIPALGEFGGGLIREGSEAGQQQ